MVLSAGPHRSRGVASLCPSCRCDVAFFIELFEAARYHRRLYWIGRIGVWGSSPRAALGALGAYPKLGPCPGLRFFRRFRVTRSSLSTGKDPRVASRALAAAFSAYVIATVALLLRNLGLYDMPLAPIFVSSSPYFVFLAAFTAALSLRMGEMAQSRAEINAGLAAEQAGPQGGRKRSKIVYSSLPC